MSGSINIPIEPTISFMTECPVCSKPPHFKVYHGNTACPLQAPLPVRQIRCPHCNQEIQLT